MWLKSHLSENSMFTNVLQQWLNITFSPLVTATAHAQWHLKQTEHEQLTLKRWLICYFSVQVFKDSPNSSNGAKR
jgi:hypothetical protein